MKAVVAGIGGLVAGLVLAGGVAVADPSVVADVRVGIFTLFDEAANRSTPTGRQFDDDVSQIQREVTQQELRQAVDCINSWHSGEPVFNTYCPIEEAPPVEAP